MFKIDKSTKIVLLVLALVFVIVILFYYYELLQSRVIIKKYSSNQVVEEKKEPGLITVYVCGQVKKSGVYDLPEGSRVKDALNLAQGPAEDADLTKVNLAQRLYDEDRVYVPEAKKKSSKSSKKEKKQAPKTKTKQEKTLSDKVDPEEIDENDLLIEEGILEIKKSGRYLKK
ncbi:MAG: SLBB domain-containing protein [Armatimonadota bacterium]